MNIHLNKYFEYVIGVLHMYQINKYERYYMSMAGLGIYQKKFIQWHNFDQACYNDGNISLTKFYVNIV